MGGKRLPRHWGLAELARKQDGVVSIRQLRDLGYSNRSVERATNEGRLHRLHRGVYAVGYNKPSLRGTCRGAVLACGSGALLSHWSAAWLWGLLPTQPIPVHVTTPIPRRLHPPIRRHHSRTLTDEDRSIEDGIPVTSVVRTALDLAVRIRAESLDRFLQRAEELNLFDLPNFESVLTRNKGHRGATPLRRALALYAPPPFTRSGLERRFLHLLADDGFARPATGYNAAGYELDVYWPELRFGVELDVFATHGSRRSFEEDRRRREDLKLAGVEMTQVTDIRLDREPQAVMDRLRQLLAQRRRELGLA
jgi:Transcriptional regulator, AbiEi antitoxin